LDGGGGKYKEKEIPGEIGELLEEREDARETEKMSGWTGGGGSLKVDSEEL